MMLLGSAAQSACHKGSSEKAAVKNDAELKRTADAARHSLDGLKPALAELDKKYRALHAEFDDLPPDLPDFGETRSKFYAAAEGVGMMSAKIPWLANRLDAALKAGDSAKLAQVSKEITDTYDEVRRADQINMELVHQVLPFKRLHQEIQERTKAECKK